MLAAVITSLISNKIYVARDARDFCINRELLMKGKAQYS
jgi:hypothetical protein